MDARARTIIEIDTLWEIRDELDYYRLLLVDRDCAQDEIGAAFRRESRRLHPDRLAALRDDGAQGKANDIFRVVNEAYRTLLDPEARARYDQVLDSGGLRMTDDAARAAAGDKHGDDPEHAATDPRAEKFWKLALRDWKDENFKACVMNIKFALNFERDNELMNEWLQKALIAEEEAEAKREKNPYKLRIM